MLAAGAAVVVVAYLVAPKAALLGFALFVLFHNTFAYWLGSAVGSFDEVALPLLVVAAAWRTKPWRRNWVEPIRDGAMLVVVALAILSSLLNSVPLTVWGLSLLLMLKGIAFLYVVLWHSFDERDVRQATIAVFAVGTVVLALGFVETLYPSAFRTALNLPGSLNTRGQLPGTESIFVFPVLFSWFMAVVAMFLFSYYLALRRTWLLIAAALFVGGTFLSGRRRAIAGIAVALGAALLAEFRSGTSRRALVRLWLPIGGAALIVAIIFAPGLSTLYEQTVNEWLFAPPPPTPQVPGPDGIDFTNGNVRLLLYETSVKIAEAEFPLGAGLGRYGSPMSRIDFSPLYQQYGLDRIWGLTPLFPAFVTDTFWPHILAEAGVLAVAAYLVFLGALGVALWKATRRVTRPYLHAFCLGAWMVFVHALVESLASSMYESPPRIYLAFGAMGIAIVLGRQADHLATQSQSVEINAVAVGPQGNI